MGALTVGACVPIVCASGKKWNKVGFLGMDSQ